MGKDKGKEWARGVQGLSGMVREVACKAEIPPDKSMSMLRVSGAADRRSVPPAQSSLWVRVMRPPSVVVAAVGWQWVGSGLAMRGAMMDHWQMPGARPMHATLSRHAGAGAWGRASGALARVIRNSGNDFDHR
jgi:hypothetical protein